ncbi:MULTISPECIES: hypothetical protein [unclassified Streptomyces]|uniref:hypothetical protein n=1 Tax=unclassified Streptomyces TaxID=2593676 RepID=UPI00117FC526|nr:MULTISPECIES: hypothetical protein [unclassified Streptomyces]
MTQAQRIAVWVGATLFGVACLGLGIYMAQIGLEKADQVSGILGMIIGLAGLVASVWSMINARNAIRPPGQSQLPRLHQSQRSGDNSKNYQSGGNMNIGDNNKF